MGSITYLWASGLGAETNFRQISGPRNNVRNYWALFSVPFFPSLGKKHEACVPPPRKLSHWKRFAFSLIYLLLRGLFQGVQFTRMHARYCRRRFTFARDEFPLALRFPCFLIFFVYIVSRRNRKGGQIYSRGFLGWLV